MAFIKENISTIAVGIVVFGVVLAVAIRMIQNKKNHRHACSGCDGCSCSNECPGK